MSFDNKWFHVWWSPRSRGSVCGFWWFGGRSGTSRFGFALVAPWSPPLFSERYGRRKPLLRAFGWRILGPYPR